MPNNKKHKISKISKSDTAHPYSRKATQMRRALNRDDKLHKQKSDNNVKRTRVVERLLWFKYAIEDDTVALTIDQVHDIIHMYIGRNDDEIEEIVANMRKGRPPPGRLELLRNLRAKDMQEFNVGIVVPDLTAQKNVAALKSWEGDYNGMGHIKSVSVANPLATRIMPVPSAGKPKDTTMADATTTGSETNTIEAITGMDVDQ
ncbi:hypothetical protein HKX48_000707 [Thoreauomyces humboldtii]|nr:hypothetical protein HKX48_000707 [Thoreauomyces humboldtii]